MYTERLAIQDSLRDIERRLDEAEKEMMELRNYKMQLRTERTQYIQRLREIDDRDMKSNSIDVMESLSSKLTDALGTIAKIIPDIPATTMIEHLQKEGSIKAEQVIPAEEKDPEPTEVQKAATDQILKMKPKKLSVEESSSIIKNIIEEKGGIVPLQIIEHEFQQRTGHKYVAFSQKMTDAMELFPSIKRVSRGKFTVEHNSQTSKLSLIDITDRQKGLVEA